MTNIIKQITKLFFISLLFFIVANIVSAQESSDAKKYGVTFPVAELGNCANLSSCRAYCDNQANRAQCTAFAKKKGFYKEPPADTKQQSLVQDAKATLGCSDEASCRQLCSQEGNRQKCMDFAKSHNLDVDGQGSGGGPGGGDQKIMQKAKEILGCNSESSCRAVCEQESNRDKCSRFAQETGMGGGTRRVGPGGCNSEESCRAYCDTHEEECRKFGGGPEGDDRGGKGPRNDGRPVCTTREECAAFCKNPANAEACKNVVIKGDENKGPSAEEVREKMGGLRQNILQMPQESQACVKQAIGADNYAKIMAGESLTSPIDGSAMQSCFAQGVKEFEEKEMLKKPKKVDDFSTDYGPSGTQRENNNYEIRPPSEIQQPKQELQPTQAEASQVQGASSEDDTLFNAVFNWFIRRINNR